MIDITTLIEVTKPYAFFIVGISVGVGAATLLLYFDEYDRWKAMQDELNKHRHGRDI